MATAKNNPTPTEGGVIDHLKRRLLKETLKYAAGQQMFCKACGQILDWKTTVVFSAESDKGKATVILCETCYSLTNVKSLEAQGYTVEVDKW